jgi:uncharacterized protein (DUF1697 family)
VKRYVAFLRAINVGGHVVKMDALRRIFAGMGLANIKTFINSGNVIFDSATTSPQALEEKISRELRKALGYDVAVFIRSVPEVTAIAEHAPFASAQLKDGALFVGMLPEPPGADDKKTIASLETPVDKLRVHKREVYWYAVKNFREALFSPARMEKLLGKPATFRNINTIRRIAALVAKPCLVLVLMAPQQMPQLPTLQPSGVISYRVALIRDWTNAVLQHTPGEDDEATGGRLFEIESTRNLRAVFLAALEEFRQRYLLSYTPTGVAKSGWHSVDVKIKGRRASVKARPGYRAGS